jgi:hypothetical protein
MPRKPPAPSEPADAVLEHPLVRAPAAEAMIDELPFSQSEGPDAPAVKREAEEDETAVEPQRAANLNGY